MTPTPTISSKERFEGWFHDYYRMLMGMAVKRLKDRPVAEDLVGDTFLMAWKNIEKLEDGAIKSWLCTVLMNKIISHIKSEKVREKAIPDLIGLSREEDEIAMLLWAEMLQHMQWLASRLTPVQKKIYDLKYRQGMSVNEIAIQLNLSRNTVKECSYRITEFIRENIHKSKQHIERGLINKKRAAFSAAKRLDYNGESKTLSEWGKQYHINPDALRQRILKGWTPGQALGIEKRTYGGSKGVLCNGETKSITEWAEQCGISRDVIWRRIKTLGWPIEEALGMVPHKKKA